MSDYTRPKTLDEYQIVAVQAGYTLVVRIQRFSHAGDGSERAKVIAERSVNMRALADEAAIDEWVAAARHECREALEVGPGKYLDEPKVFI